MQYTTGRSEGAMTASRYYHPALHSRLAGIILSGTACESNYFVSCARNARICDGQCRRSIPILALVGQDDKYFSSNDFSVSYKVASAPNGYGGPITGNCRAALTQQQFPQSTVVVFEGSPHSIMYTHDNALRSVFADFTAEPQSAEPNPPRWKSLQRGGCSFTGGVHTCDSLDSAPPCQSDYSKPNSATPWRNLGVVRGCAARNEGCTALKGDHQTTKHHGKHHRKEAETKPFSQNIFSAIVSFLMLGASMYGIVVGIRKVEAAMDSSDHVTLDEEQQI